MQLLQKTWVKIIVSLLIGGMATEIFHITTGDPNRPTTSGESSLTLLFSFIAFLILYFTIPNHKK